MKSRQKKQGTRQKSASSWVTNTRLQAMALVIISVLLYAQTVRYDYVLDDKLVVAGNAFVKQGFAGIPDILTKSTFAGNLDAIKEKDNLSGGRYRPLSLVMFAVEYQFFGAKPAVGHIVNVLMYAAVVVMVFLTLQLLFKEHPSLSQIPFLSFLVALMYAAHPTHTEIVANIKGRDELLCTLLALGALFSFIRACRTDNQSSARINSFWSALALLLAFFAKESAITFLFLLPLSAWFFTPSPVRQILRVWLPVAIVAVAFLLLRAQIVGFLDSRAAINIFDNPFLRATSAERYATAVAVLGRYALSALYPFTLAYDYSYNEIPIVGWLQWQTLLSLAFHLALAAFAVLKFREKHILAYCIWWYFATISIASNLVFSIGALMGDRFLFMPTIASTLAVAWLLWRWLPTTVGKRSLVAIAIATITLVYSIRTVQRNPAWENEFSLVSADLKSAPNGLRNRCIYAGLLFRKAEVDANAVIRKQHLDEAYSHLQICLATDPACDPIAYFYLGQYHGIFYQRYDSAVFYYDKAYTMEPANKNFLVQLAINRGNLALKTQKYDEAVEQYQSVVPENKELQTLYHNSGLARANQMRYAEATEFFKQAIASGVAGSPKTEQVKATMAYFQQRAAQGGTQATAPPSTARK